MQYFLLADFIFADFVAKRNTWCFIVKSDRGSFVDFKGVEYFLNITEVSEKSLRG